MASSSSPSRQKEVSLGRSREERFRDEKLSDLYSIILATEHLESAYVRDAVTASDYGKACSKLIAQFKTLREAVSSFEPDIGAFMTRMGMQCPAAANRLLHVGVPATVEHGDTAKKSGGQQLHVAETVRS